MALRFNRQTGRFEDDGQPQAYEPYLGGSEPYLGGTTADLAGLPAARFDYPGGDRPYGDGSRGPRAPLPPPPGEGRVGVPRNPEDPVPEDPSFEVEDPPPPPPPTPGGGVDFDAFVPPSFNPGEFDAPAPFTYEPFEGPTAENFQADPGYAFRQREGIRAATNAASATGLARSGGFVKGLINYAQDAASQEFGNVWNRQYSTWDANRRNRGENYDRNWQNRLTDYLVDYERESDKFGRALQTWSANTGQGNALFAQLLSLYDLATRGLPNAPALAGYGG